MGVKGSQGQRWAAAQGPADRGSVVLEHEGQDKLALMPLRAGRAPAAAAAAGAASAGAAPAAPAGRTSHLHLRHYVEDGVLVGALHKHDGALRGREHVLTFMFMFIHRRYVLGPSTNVTTLQGSAQLKPSALGPAGGKTEAKRGAHEARRKHCVAPHAQGGHAAAGEACAAPRSASTRAPAGSAAGAEQCRGGWGAPCPCLLVRPARVSWCVLPGPTHLALWIYALLALGLQRLGRGGFKRCG